MCGICGILNFDRRAAVDRAQLESMNDVIIHRGPDDAGFYCADNVGLAMRRLSIIDVKSGHQPISNERGTVWIVFNGEIYNYKSLREQLSAAGHVFSTQSDTETIVHLYEEYGDKCVQYLRGMFAFAIWDDQRRRLLLARDRLGIKPLYYQHSGRAFVFGSEIKVLLEYARGKCAFNRNILSEYLAFGFLSGQETFCEGVLSLPAGHVLSVEETGALKVRQYWDLSPEATDEDRPREYYVQTYRELFEDCVSSHLMSEVPVGIFLSGGLDSSAVAALASKLRGPIETFSVGYKETAFSELPWARKVAQHLQSTHREVSMGPNDFFSALPKLIWHEDKPITWPSSVSLYYVAKLAREHVTVVLTGEGSDETLGGYERYAISLINARLHHLYARVTDRSLRKWLRDAIAKTQFLNANVRRKLQHTFLGRDGDAWESLYFDNFLCSFSEQEQRQLLCDEVVGASPYAHQLEFWERSKGEMLNRILYTDIKSYLVELLMKQDRMSMAASVESRVPFLDHILVEFAMRIPGRFKIRKREGKVILKSAVDGLLPQEIVYRKKMGFPTPWKTWLSGALFSHVERLLTDVRGVSRGIFRKERVQQILHEHKTGKYDHTDKLWRIVNLELWHRVFIDGEEPSETHSQQLQTAAR